MKDFINQRVRQVIADRKLSSVYLSKVTDLTQSTVARQITGKLNVSTELIYAILHECPDISPEWLLTGKGEMLRQDNEEKNELDSRENIKDVKPRIPYDAKAGRLTEMVDGVTIAQCEMSPTVRTFPNYDFTIFVTGDSMIPKYISGDEVACLRINQASFIQWGRVHVIDTSQGILLKRIYDEGEYIRCVSFNSVEYPDFLIHKSDVWSYNLVVGLLRL